MIDEEEYKDRISKVRLLRAGSAHFGLLEDELATISAWRKPAQLPHAPPAVCGVVAIQGRMLTVLDPRLLLGASAPDGTFSPCYIVELKGDEQLALAVESVDDLIEVNPEEIQSDGTEEQLVLGLVHKNEELIRVLDVKQLFPATIQGRERRRRKL